MAFSIESVPDSEVTVKFDAVLPGFMFPVSYSGVFCRMPLSHAAPLISSYFSLLFGDKLKIKQKKEGLNPGVASSSLVGPARKTEGLGNLPNPFFYVSLQAAYRFYLYNLPYKRHGQAGFRNQC
ncbi:MAG: hypothetical protein R6T98_14040 [Desulfatiglandales bacterium]